MADLVTTARAEMNPNIAGMDANWLATLITVASKAVENYCNREFTSQTVSNEIHDGDGEKDLFLRNFPVASITQVVITENDGDTVTITGTYFRINQRTGQIIFEPAETADYSYFPEGFQNISVTYVAGYSTIPEPVQEATVQLIAWLKSESDKDPNLKAEKLGDWSASYGGTTGTEGGLPQSVRRLLGAYRSMSV